MGAQMAGVASQSFTPRAVGGDVFPNQIYKVNENGPEMFNFGGNDFLSTGSARGSIKPNGDFGMGTSGGKTNVTVNVYTTEGNTATVEQREDSNGGITLDVIMEQVDDRIAEGVRNGISQTSQAISGVFGLNRAVGALV